MRSLSKYTWLTLALISLLAGLLVTPSAQAQLEGAVKKQEEKKASRFSLAEWLEQKQKNQLADLWLAKNSHSSPFEFFFELQSLNYTQFLGSSPETHNNRNTYGASAAAYAGVAGLRAGYEADTESRSTSHASLNLRLFGHALQDTHINLEYGLRTLTDTYVGATENFQNQFGGVSLNIYVTKHFGVEGAYRKILPSESEQKRQGQGESSQAGVFIDFSVLRVFGSWRKEYLKFEAPGGMVSSEFREGFGGGLRFYF